MKTKKERDKARQKKAQEIADAVKRGEYEINTPEIKASAFPPARRIKKDEEAMRKLFGPESEEKE